MKEDDGGYEDVEDLKVTSVCIVKHQSLLSNGLGQSFTILVPEGYGLSLLRKLVYSGCKAIGEREHLKLMMECNKRIYPYDYYDTSACQVLHRTLAFE